MVVRGWVKSLVELVRGVFWILFHPIAAFGRVAQLVTGAFRVFAKPRRVGGFLRESPYEPYKAMTTMAVVGAVGVVGMGLLHSEQGLVVAEIILSASGIAYVLWRSVEFFHGNEASADGIDGFILVVELVPVIGGLAVISRLARMEGVIARVEGLTARTQGAMARTGRVASKGTSVPSKTAKIVRDGIKTGKAAKGGVESIVQPTVSVGEWATHWVKVSDEFTQKFFRPLREIGKRIKR